MRKSESTGENRTHAVVVGGSIAGMLAARALSDHYQRVTILEQDRLENGAAVRKGVPQGRHVHGLLDRGATIIARLFPGIFEEIQADGGATAEMGPDLLYFQMGRWKPRIPTGLIGQFHSRPLLEWGIRRRLAKVPNVGTFRGDVLGYTTSEDRAHVTGVRLRLESGEEVNEPADLVVDASGRGSRTPAWLEALGYPRVEETEIRVDVGYSTRMFRPPPRPRDWKFMLILPKAPEQRRMGVLAPIEGGRWIVMMAGWLKDYPPSDGDAFLEHAKTLPAPDLYEAIRDAEPLGPVATHRFPSNLRRHYERMKRFPEGLVVLGDAHCSFNPIYGQGMTTAALNVEALDGCLRERQGAVPSRVFRQRIAAAVEAPWGMVTTEDLRFPEVQGPRPASHAFISWYVAKVAEISGWDPVVFSRFAQVMHLNRPPPSLFAPAVLGRVLSYSLLGKGAPGEPAPVLTEREA